MTCDGPVILAGIELQRVRLKVSPVMGGPALGSWEQCTGSIPVRAVVIRRQSFLAGLPMYLSVVLAVPPSICILKKCYLLWKLNNGRGAANVPSILSGSQVSCLRVMTSNFIRSGTLYHFARLLKPQSSPQHNALFAKVQEHGRQTLGMRP